MQTEIPTHLTVDQIAQHWQLSLRIGGRLRFDPSAIRVFAKGERPTAAVVPMSRDRGR